MALERKAKEMTICKFKFLLSMKQVDRRFWIAGSAVLWCLATGSRTPAQIVQIVPDSTLPGNSAVTPNGNTITITGGTSAGTNLFHSFKEFSLPTGTTAHFNNYPAIQNIFTRVTGGSISNIDGVIRANGNANLFLLNPSGIIFGPNASLNIGGSFLASTANRIKFAGGAEFSATNPQTPPLLTVSVPVGLQLGPNPGAIRVRGAGHSLSRPDPIFGQIVGAGSISAGLRVRNGKTLALVGGDIFLEGGILTAEGGRIELGSVGEGDVSFAGEGLTLGYEGAVSFRDIQLSQRALARASEGIAQENVSIPGGSVQVRGRNLSVRDGSVILIQNSGSQPSGDLTVRASEELEVSGTAPDLSIRSTLSTESLAEGKGGNIGVDTERLIVRDGGEISTKTFTTAPAGNIAVSASDAQVIGFSPANPNFFSIIRAVTFSSADAGDVTVSARRLTAKDGGLVASATFGTGSGGNLSVSATDFIELTGVAARVLAPSGLAASTLGEGKAGSLKVSTSRLLLRDGGRISSSALAAGDAGSIAINASDSVELSGRVPGSRNPTQILSAAIIQDESLQQLYRLPPVPSGASGDVTVNTPRLSVTSGAQVTVRNDGAGAAGYVRINAGSIFLDNSGLLTAATTSGEGGNIILLSQNLQMRHNSQISATAGGTGNGGNLTISTDTLAALEDSNIAANSVQAQGGKIRIRTQGIFRSLDSDITATGGKSQLNGTVEINTPNVDKLAGLVTLPADVVDLAALIGSDACAASRRSRFVVTGRGGLPPRPDEMLVGETVLMDWGTLEGLEGGTGHRQQLNQFPMPDAQFPMPNSLVEATGWVIGSNGEVILTAEAPAGTPHSPWIEPAGCSVRRE
jgi:filamentous hemagglutinin family protein